MKQRLYLAALIAVFTMNTMMAQHLGMGVTLGLRKDWQITKKSVLDVRQQIQVNPEVRKFQSKFGDIFNEEGFWPIPDRLLDEDDDNDEDDGRGGRDGELNDDPYDVSFEWRSSTVVRGQYSFFNWLRLASGYTLFYNGEEFRHAWQSELDYRPLLHSKAKRKFDISTRVGFQRTGRPNKGSMRWQSFLTPRLNMTLKVDKKHTLYAGAALNGAWDDKELEFDRYRLNAGVQFAVNKKNLFDLGYQFQQRLDKPGKSNAISISYTIRI